jgi:hypothetical protein
LLSQPIILKINNPTDNQPKNEQYLVTTQIPLTTVKSKKLRKIDFYNLFYATNSPNYLYLRNIVSDHKLVNIEGFRYHSDNFYKRTFVSPNKNK